MLTYFLIGLLLGVGTGVPMGPVSIAVIGNAYRDLRSNAILAGCGGAFADACYAALGILALGPLLERHPDVPPVLYLLSGLFLITFGVLSVRTPAPQPITVDPTVVPPAERGLMGAFATGMGLIFMNPATMVTWVVVVGSFATGLSQANGWSIVAGIGLGSASWFALVAVLAQRGKQRFGTKIAWIPRAVGMLLIVYSVFSIGRGARHWFS